MILTSIYSYFAYNHKINSQCSQHTIKIIDKNSYYNNCLNIMRFDVSFQQWCHRCHRSLLMLQKSTMQWSSPGAKILFSDWGGQVKLLRGTFAILSPWTKILGGERLSFFSWRPFFYLLDWILGGRSLDYWGDIAYLVPSNQIIWGDLSHLSLMDLRPWL